MNLPAWLLIAAALVAVGVATPLIALADADGSGARQIPGNTQEFPLVA